MSLSSYETSTQDSLSWDKMSSLPIGQELEIHETKYCIMGRVEKRLDDYRWVEYDIETDLGVGARLSVALSSDSGCVMSFHAMIPFPSQDTKTSVLWNGELYELTEHGEAVVTDYQGQGCYDGNERFNFEEYHSQFGELLTCEYWEYEREAFIGRKLNQADLKIWGVSYVSAKKLTRSVKDWVTNGIFCIYGSFRLSRFLLHLFCWFFVVWIIWNVLSGRLFDIMILDKIPHIERQLSSSSSFRHVTSVQINDETREVYSTPLSVDAACRAVIVMDPKHIEFMTTTTNELEDGEEAECMVRTSRETVMIYQSEDSGTYIQVAPNKADNEGSYTSYRARKPNRFLLLYLGSTAWDSWGRPANREHIYDIDSTRYAPAVAEARQTGH